MSTSRGSRIAVVVWTLLVLSGVLTAQARKGTFSWYAELVAFEPKTRTLTVKAPIEPHVARYIGTFKQGDRIAIVWSQFNGNADAIRYVTTQDSFHAQAGYIVRGRFVSADAGMRTLTFTTSVQATAAATVAAARPGTPIRVSAPLIPPARTDSVVAVVATNVTPPLRPAKPVTKAAVENVVRQVAGRWSIETKMPGATIQLTCIFTQDGAILGGTCKGEDPIGEVQVADASMDRDTVNFSVDIPQGGYKIPMNFRGTLDAQGTAIDGNAGYGPDSYTFKGTRR